jgi:hypothetical protein
VAGMLLGTRIRSDRLIFMYSSFNEQVKSSKGQIEAYAKLGSDYKTSFQVREHM